VLCSSTKEVRGALRVTAQNTPSLEAEHFARDDERMRHAVRVIAKGVPGVKAAENRLVLVHTNSVLIYGGEGNWPTPRTEGSPVPHAVARGRPGCSG
jgi:hypothetical protein